PMTRPPDEGSPELERVVDAISEGEAIEWEKAAGDRIDAETLAALRLIDTVSRLHRSGGALASPDGAEPEAGAAGRNTDGHGESEPAKAGAERTWGNLRIRGPLGAGVYGEVYRAFDPGLRREVALKLWSPTDRPSTIERLLEEGRALARVRHPNVLLVHGADVHDRQVGMWTELLEGSTLEEWID